MSATGEDLELLACRNLYELDSELHCNRSMERFLRFPYPNSPYLCYLASEDALEEEIQYQRSLRYRTLVS